MAACTLSYYHPADRAAAVRAEAVFLFFFIFQINVFVCTSLIVRRVRRRVQSISPRMYLHNTRMYV